MFSVVFVFVFSNLFYMKKINNTQIYDNTLILKNEKQFTNIRQLTFSGENAEAYFSSDGKRLIFQSHDGGSFCDRIYTLNLESGDITMASNGDGVTTCSYFVYPECKNIIYSSTHLGSKNCPPKPDYSKGYVWKLYQDYDIFLSDLNKTFLKRLTNAPGYDAEGTVAFDGSKIIYTSMMSGDLDIWTMNIDGTGKTQLTNRVGYDGGPLFSIDGSKIVWRAYHPQTAKEIAEYNSLLSQNIIRPMELQIWIMNSDGTEKKQITNNSSANFCPYFFQNGNRINFSSNLHDPQGRNFDLYAINTDGSQLERITFFNGFDGFPMFSPDGDYIVFASNRNQLEQGETNLFIAKWKQ